MSAYRTPQAAARAMPELYAELRPPARRQLVAGLHARSGRSSWRRLLGLTDRQALELLDELGLDRRPGPDR